MEICHKSRAIVEFDGIRPISAPGGGNGIEMGRFRMDGNCNSFTGVGRLCQPKSGTILRQARDQGRVVIGDGHVWNVRQ